jgi:hypothetical protein
MMSFLVVSVGREIFQVPHIVPLNAPSVLDKMTTIFSPIGIFIASALMGVPIIRDYRYNVAPLLFTKPITTSQYLGGRFIGTLIIMIGIIAAFPLGILALDVLGLRDTAELQTINLWYYIRPFLLITLPNTIFLGALFFMGGALTRSMKVVYAQGLVIFIILVFLDESIIEQASNQNLALLFDFFTAQLFISITQYWSLVEQATSVVPFTGTFLLNRLIWVSVSAVLLFMTFSKFKFEESSIRVSRKRAL